MPGARRGRPLVRGRLRRADGLGRQRRHGRCRRHRRRPGLERRRREGRARLGPLHHRDAGRGGGLWSRDPGLRHAGPGWREPTETATASGFSTGSGWAGIGALTVATGESSSSMSDSSEGRRTKAPSWAASWLSMDGPAVGLDLRRTRGLVEDGSKRSAPVSFGGRGNAGAGNADDVGFDHHVVEAADQQQVLDIVPAQQDELPLPVEIVDVDDAEPGLAAAAAIAAPASSGGRPSACGGPRRRARPGRG